MKKYAVTLLLLISSATCYAFQGFDPGAGFGDGEDIIEPTEAYACSNCSSQQARNIALNHAPVNRCDLYRNGPMAEFCESITKEVLVPAHGSENIYKFSITTSIDSSNRPFVQVMPSLFVTSTETVLMHKYFDLYEEIGQAVANASISSSDLNNSSSVLNKSKFDGRGFMQSLTTDACEGHPITSLKSPAAIATKKLELSFRIIDHMGDSTPLEYTTEYFTTGGGLGVTAAGGEISVGGQYLTNVFLVTEGDNNFNVLAFNIYLSQDPITKVNHVGLTINRLFTKIDGIQMSDFFGPLFDLSDYEGYEISSCVDDFIEDDTKEADDGPAGGGGSGTEQDPFIGDSITGNNNSFQFCKFRRTANSCSTTQDGIKTCTATIFQVVKPCSSFP